MRPIGRNKKTLIFFNLHLVWFWTLPGPKCAQVHALTHISDVLIGMATIVAFRMEGVNYIHVHIEVLVKFVDKLQH
jgi:hypothetical protein